MPVDPTVLKHRIKEIRSSISELTNLTSKPFEELNTSEIYSIRYLIIVIVEALVSICIHISTEAYNETPESYREAIRIIGSKLRIKCIRDLEALVALRNLLIHRYWTIDDKRIHESIKRNFECLDSFLTRIEEEFLR